MEPDIPVTYSGHTSLRYMELQEFWIQRIRKNIRYKEIGTAIGCNYTKGHHSIIKTLKSRDCFVSCEQSIIS